MILDGWYSASASATMLLPRSVKRKYVQIDNESANLHDSRHQQRLNATATQFNATIDNSIVKAPSSKAHAESFAPWIDATEDESIKQFSSQQRLHIPNSEEPFCIICGKYGEYINDDTENDVCSRECKLMDTNMSGPFRATIAQSKPTPLVVVHQSSSVAENVHAKLTNYQEAPSVASMPQDQVKSMLQAHEIDVKGKGVPRPIVTFDQCSQVFGQQLLKNLDRQGWSTATSVQRQAVPAMLVGRDVVVVSPAGSGKTAAFVLPILAHCQSLSAMHRHKRRLGPYALILSPTRDLCAQIESTIKRLSTGIQNMRTALLVGGEPLPDQLYRLRKGVQIVIGTPARVSDISVHHPHMLRLWRMRILVLDEADILFGSGMKKHVKSILNNLSVKIVRQFGYFSTSISPELSKVVRRMTHHIEIRVSQPNEKEESKAAQQLSSTIDVKQTILWVENASKTKRLLSILDDRKYFSAPALVFVESNLAVLNLTQSIRKKRKYNHWRVVAMDSEKSLKERSAIIEGMNSDPPEWDVVISTDVLARGIDLPSVSLVINYDMAKTVSGYVHRIAKAVVPDKASSKRKRGWAITFINKDHERLFSQLYAGLSNKSPMEVTPLPSQLKKELC